MAKSLADVARAAQAGLEKVGLVTKQRRKVVPFEITEEMKAAAMAAPMPITILDKPGYQAIWEAMFEAAPGAEE